MNLTRRGLFRFLPAIPLAARGVKAEVERLSGMASLGEGAHMARFAGNVAGEAPFSSPGVACGGEPKRGRTLVDFLKKLGLPSWKKEELRRTARYSRLIDPDLAALRSVSPAAMLRLQWARNEAELERQFYAQQLADEERNEFLAKHFIGWM
jgi:hypothetical protein